MFTNPYREKCVNILEKLLPRRAVQDSTLLQAYATFHMMKEVTLSGANYAEIYRAASRKSAPYEKYKEIIELTTTQFWNYQQRFKDYLDGKISLAERVTDSDKQSFETIEKNVEALNNELREHLQKIYIVT